MDSAKRSNRDHYVEMTEEGDKPRNQGLNIEATRKDLDFLPSFGRCSNEVHPVPKKVLAARPVLLPVNLCPKCEVEKQ